MGKPKPIFVRCQNHEEVRTLLHYVVQYKNQRMRETWNGVEGYIDQWPNSLIININAQRRPEHGTLGGYSIKDFEGSEVKTITYPEYFRRIRQPIPPLMPAPVFVKKIPEFLIGFEIEGCMERSIFGEFVNYLHDLYEGDGDYPFDRSVRARVGKTFAPFEFCTPALPLEEAQEKIGWLLGILNILSEEEYFETNQTCGFHVNISEAHTFRSPFRKYREKIAYEFMHGFDIMKWRATFKRVHSRYCKWKNPPRTIQDVARVPVGKNECGTRTSFGHYWGINACHLNRIRPAERRLEIRVGGNEDYHKHPDIEPFLDDIVSSFQSAYETI